MIPVGLNLKDKNVLIIGGGKVAFRKAKLFLSKQAIVRVVSPTFIDECLELDVTCIVSYYQEEQLNDCFLVYACTNDANVNLQIARDCHKRNILCGSATRNDLVSFNSMAFEETEVGVVALSTYQKMPYTKPLLKELKDTLDTHHQQLQELSIIREYLVQTKNTSPNLLNRLYEVKKEVLTFICESIKQNKGYIFVYHQSNYQQRYQFDLHPNIVLSLKEFEELQDVLSLQINYQVIPLLLSDGYIYQKLKKGTKLNVLKPLICHPDDISSLIELCHQKGKTNVWLMHPRSQTVLLDQIKEKVPKGDLVQTFNDPLRFEKGMHVVVLLMSEGEHYHDLMKQIPEGVSVSQILPLEDNIKNYILNHILKA